MPRKKTLLTKVAIWWLSNYEECVHFWIGFNWILAMAIFIIGALKGIDLGFIGCFIFVTALILNAGLVFAIRTIKLHLYTLERGDPGRGEVHELLVRVIRRRILKYTKE
jgi:hypothetical protein